jgi:hypothetical protein
VNSLDPKDALKWSFIVYVRIVSVLSDHLAGHWIPHARLHIQTGCVFHHNILVFEGLKMHICAETCCPPCADW